MSITPTVGRVVWFTPATQDELRPNNHQPLAAIIAHVWSDTCVNLAVFDANGANHSRTSVYLAQDDMPRPGAGFCQWMPYQKGQAAKTEQVIKEAAARVSPVPVVEKDLINAGLTAPRVTSAAIEAAIDSEHYFTAEDGATNSPPDIARRGDFPPLALLTFCVLVLKNGFTVTGESACADPRNFNVEIGRRIARTHAVEKIWPLLGYELRTKLSGG